MRERVCPDCFATLPEDGSRCPCWRATLTAHEREMEQAALVAKWWARWDRADHDRRQQAIAEVERGRPWGHFGNVRARKRRVV